MVSLLATTIYLSDKIEGFLAGLFIGLCASVIVAFTAYQEGRSNDSRR